MRTAIAHRHAKALGRTQYHVGALLTRWGQHQQAEQVGGYASQGVLVMQLRDQRPQVADLAVGVGVLQQSPEYLVIAEVIHSIDDQFEAESFGAGLQHREGLWMAMLIGKEHVAFRLGHAFGQGHGFSGCSSFIEQGGVSQVQAGEVDNHLLEIQQGFQAALGNFRLIRRVGGVPTRVFQDVAQDDVRRDGSVIAHADQAGPHLVLLGIAPELVQGSLFIQGGGQVQRTVQTNARRHGLLDQLAAGAQAEGLEHYLLLCGIGAQVATQERIGVVQLAQGRRLGHSGSLFLDQASTSRGILSLGRDCRFV
ncbi:hypothetical protein D9M71_332740 [compost metagenome]